MAVILNLKPEVEAGLLAQARASGMTVEAYILAMVERALVPGAAPDLGPEERAAAFEAWSAGHQSTPDLPDEAVSRESMYDDRDR